LPRNKLRATARIHRKLLQAVLRLLNPSWTPKPEGDRDRSISVDARHTWGRKGPNRASIPYQHWGSDLFQIPVRRLRMLNGEVILARAGSRKIPHELGASTTRNPTKLNFVVGSLL